VILVDSAEQSGLDLHGGGTGWSGESERSKLTSGEKVLTPRSYSDLIVSISVYSNPPGRRKVEAPKQTYLVKNMMELADSFSDRDRYNYSFYPILLPDD